VKTKKERKEEEPPAAVRIAGTSVTPEPPPAATILPVIDNSPCTVRNRRRNTEKTETEENIAEKIKTQRRRRKKPQPLPPCLSPATVIHCEQEGGHTSTAEREETLLTERMKNRGRKQHIESEGRRRKTAASATVCHHRWHHAALHARPPPSQVSLPPPFFFFFFFPAVHCTNSRRELIHAFCSCSSGMRPRFFWAGSGPVSKKIFLKKIVISPRILLQNFD
jgi:hypothetical protein